MGYNTGNGRFLRTQNMVPHTFPKVRCKYCKAFGVRRSYLQTKMLFSSGSLVKLANHYELIITKVIKISPL
jgi:hypothetical protein